MKPQFSGGHNIAMKLPRAQFEQTIAFYRDVLGFEVVDESEADAAAGVPQSASVRFGPLKLWFDRVDNYAQAEVWLELFTDDVEAATRHLAEHGVLPQDELESLPEGLAGHWVTNPVGIPHLVRLAD